MEYRDAGLTEGNKASSGRDLHGATGWKESRKQILIPLRVTEN